MVALVEPKEELCKEIVNMIRTEYGMEVDCEDIQQLHKLQEALLRLPKSLIGVCGIRYMGFKDQGVSKEYYPNHGYYVDNRLVLNTQLISDPQIFLDPSGRSLDRFEHTLYHEMGHGFDEVIGGGPGLEASLEPGWLELSGWSKNPTVGSAKLVLKKANQSTAGRVSDLHKSMAKNAGDTQITIKEKGAPALVGEWYYDSEAGFPRFYAKRNPWDDFADCFAFYVGGLKGFLPASKINYFDKALQAYLGG